MSPCWHLTYLKQCNTVFITQSHTYSSEQDQLPKELKPHSSHLNKTSTKGTPHTLNHTASSPFFPQAGLEDTRAWSFSIWYYQLNHKWDSCITRSKISYSLIEPQPLPSTPAFGHEFHALAFHPHPTFTAPLVGSAFKIGLDVCCGVFWGGTINVFKLLAVYAEELWNYNKGILNSIWLLILLIHIKHKYNKM